MRVWAPAMRKSHPMKSSITCKTIASTIYPQTHRRGKLKVEKPYDELCVPTKGHTAPKIIVHAISSAVKRTSGSVGVILLH